MYGHPYGCPIRTYSFPPNVSRGETHTLFTERMDSVQSVLNDGCVWGGRVQGGQEGQSSGSAPRSDLCWGGAMQIECKGLQAEAAGSG